MFSTFSARVLHLLALVHDLFDEVAHDARCPRRVVDHDDAEVVKERDRRGPARARPRRLRQADTTA